jgi:hypothetical protein
MKSILVEQGVKKMVMMGAALFIAIVVFIALLEKVALILSYYFA